MPRLFTIFFLLLSGFLFSQESRLLVMGRIVSARDNVPVENVVVLCKNPQRETHSDKKGHYAILLEQKAGQVLEFRLYGYQVQTRTITAAMLQKTGGDTIRLDIVLKPEVLTIYREFTVSSGPDTVIGNWHFFIEDYQFLNDSQYVLLTFEKTLKKAKVMLADERQHILASAEVPGEATGLYRDYQGYINVMCKDSAFRVKIVPPGLLLLLALPYREFCDRILSCVDTLGGKILFTNYQRNYPAFSYFAYDPFDTTVEQLHYIVDQDLLAQYNWEFDFLKPKDRLYARKMSAWTGIDPRIVAATLTGFPESINYTPLYAPMYVVHDTICVFDHYSDSLFLFDRNDQLIGASKIDYHHPKNWKEWDRGILKDEVTGEVYARFEKDGYYTLKKIDLRSGKVTGSYRIGNQYPKHIRIRNGEVYYIWQPADSLQKKFLYKERIQL
jgi:hypothetical protein